MTLCQAALGPVVQTEYGKVEGRYSVEEGTEYFWGIPYGAPTNGTGRFAPPAAPEPWTETHKSALLPLQMCVQIHPTEHIIVGTEDCLTLDIYRPTLRDPLEKLPVLVWIYGGAFIFGGDDVLNKYNGNHLARDHRVIVVAMNYRVDNLGFLALDSLLKEHGTTGNYGLLDQQFALKWVQRNIAEFGGDAKKVTLFGQSAGGCSVTAQLAMPGSRGLFHAAIAESPIPVSDISWVSLKNATDFGEFYATQVGCPSNMTGPAQIACLRSKSLDDVVNPLIEWRKKFPSGDIPAMPRLLPVMGWWPTIDGAALPKTPVDAASSGEFADVPFAIGTVRDEGSIFVPLIPLIVNGKEPVLLPLTQEGLNKTVAHFFNATVAAAALSFYGADQSPPPETYIKIAAKLVRDVFFTCASRNLLRTVLAAPGRKSKGWTYQFNRVMNGAVYKEFGDFHTAEIPYVFMQAAEEWDAQDEALSAQMSGLWTSLARSGEPSCPTCPKWTEYTAEADNFMSFNGNSSMSTHLEKDACDFWDHWGYVNNP